MAAIEFALTEAELREKCPEWQKVLRLQDWGIKVRLARARDLMEYGDLGQCQWNNEHKRAEILILDPNDYDPGRQIPYDMEQTLVHELLHLHFSLFMAKDETPEATAQEQAINAMATALVTLKRNPKLPELPELLSAPTGAL